MFPELLPKPFVNYCQTFSLSNYNQNVFQDADAKNEEDGGESIEVGKDEMVPEDDLNDDGIAEAIAEAAQEAELKCIAEVAEKNKGVLANISMSSKTSQESRMESAAETCRFVQSCVSIHIV